MAATPRCPRCQAADISPPRSRIAAEGIVLAFTLTIVLVPAALFTRGLSLIGLPVAAACWLIRERYRVCLSCRSILPD